MSETARALHATGSVESRTHGRFFFSMALVLLAITFAGFAPSYFLKTVFDTPALSRLTHVHGAIFTSWFVLFAVQTALVARRDIGLHRRLGVVGGFLIAAMVASALSIVYYRALRYDGSEGDLIATTLVVVGNMAPLTLFAGFAVLGIAMRRRREWHQRLMLLASFSMMGQSLGRFGRSVPLQLGGSPLITEVVFGLGGLVALLATLCIYDLVTRRRLHPVTAIGCPVFLVTLLFAALVLPYTRAAQAVILWLN